MRASCLHRSSRCSPVIQNLFKVIFIYSLSFSSGSDPGRRRISVPAALGRWQKAQEGSERQSVCRTCKALVPGKERPLPPVQGRRRPGPLTVPAFSSLVVLAILPWVFKDE